MTTRKEVAKGYATQLTEGGKPAKPAVETAEMNLPHEDTDQIALYVQRRRGTHSQYLVGTAKNWDSWVQQLLREPQ